MSKREQTAATNKPGIHLRLIDGLLNLPRILRIIIAAVFGLATTLALFEVVDQIYLQMFFNPNTILLPALVSGGFGMLMYVVGWGLIVGTIGEDREAKMVTFWYLLTGLFALMLVGLWFLRLILLDSGVA